MATTSLRGRELLRNPILNKGVAFPAEERSALGLHGLLPPAVLGLEDQARRAYAQYRQIPDDVGRSIMLWALLNRNQTLFHRLLLDHLADMLPVVYTPTVGTVIQQYSRDFRRPTGVYLSVDEPGSVRQALSNYGLTGDEVDLVVVTDGEGILGIGDWGVGGIAIATGKLAVYTAAAGIDPARVVPVVLDVGTDNEELLDDPLYVGNRHARVRGERYEAFVDEFVRAVGDVFPHALLHWEDLGADNATRILQCYRDTVCTFNDDVQGTGAVVLAAGLAASAASGVPLRDQRVVVFGAGTAGIGIADQIRDEMVRQGLDRAAATRRFWCLGRRGLLVDGGPGIRDFQQPYARPAGETAEWSRDHDSGGIDLAEVVRRARPTVLIGTSGTPGAFDEGVVREMARHVERPVVLPLSNPTSLAEAQPSDLVRWTDGRALVATGSPFPPVAWAGTTHVIAQANNALVFPGLGLGVVVSRARLVTDGMLAAAAQAVARAVDATATGAPVLPAIDHLRAVSAAVAVAVAETASAEGVARTRQPDWDAAVRAAMWVPVYRPLSAG
ncbi:NAD-dependent malic enzyme [Geodermatophilus sabuli]|uniref:Putative malate oxidoreductase [NAD] n=1 Tax=Geodermatophilus sabuli TaxID=1564158 RepID=A0A7K3VWR0_9ACTN|nr:NAD-dependent malic enzyme [Geodermatophilus sabuli]NEK56768.1 NAD-dependent malic enzyme [Geodermatophilus sabuli]